MRPSRQVLGLCLLILFGLATAACVGSANATGNPGSDEREITDEGVTRTTIVPTMRPTSAEDLSIVLDENGRPYDNYVGPRGVTAEERLLTSLKIDRGRFYLVAGESLLSGDPIEETDKVTVTFRNNTDLDVRVIWGSPPEQGGEPVSDPESNPQSEPDPELDPESEPDPELDPKSAPDSDSDSAPPVETILGVRIGIRDRTVAQWGRLEPAYETTRGLGGLISRTAFEVARDSLEEDQPVLPEGLTEGRPFLLDDLAGEQGRDLLLFENGGGRGTYYYSEGFDEDRIKVAIMIWDLNYPWRLAVPEGEPPGDVVEREQKLIDCIEGRRAIDRWGRCT